MEFVGVNRSPLVRQVNEAVRTVISKADCIMNSKTEFHQAPLVRIVPMTGLQEMQGTGRCSLQQGGVGRGRGGQRGGGRQGQEKVEGAGHLGPIDQPASVVLSSLLVLLV